MRYLLAVVCVLGFAGVSQAELNYGIYYQSQPYYYAPVYQAPRYRVLNYYGTPLYFNRSPGPTFYYHYYNRR